MGVGWGSGGVGREDALDFDVEAFSLPADRYRSLTAAMGRPTGTDVRWLVVYKTVFARTFPSTSSRSIPEFIATASS